MWPSRRNRACPTTPRLSPRELQDIRVAPVSYPRLVTAAAIQGMRNALFVLQQSVRAACVSERPELAVSFGEIPELMGLDTIKQMARRFLSAQQLAAKSGKAAE